MEFDKEKTESNEPDEFYFESDHLALKGNKDYLALLKVLAILQAQRIKVLQPPPSKQAYLSNIHASFHFDAKSIHQTNEELVGNALPPPYITLKKKMNSMGYFPDIDKIQIIKKRALEDPDKFISNLEDGGDLGVPPHQVVAELPKIDWSQYNTTVPGGLNRPVTRQVASHPTNNSCSSGEAASDSNGNNKHKVTVRGRAFDESKPETFNQLWTADEQRRLEELLVEFPPEEIESRRYKKIAEALGNRTVLQVSSRVQKYFLKLMKAGLPIPGRAPKYNADVMKKSSSHFRQRVSNYLSRPSTFFPSNQDLPVYMTDAESAEQPLTQNLPHSQVLSSTSIKEELETDSEHRKNVFRRIREDKESGVADQILDSGYKCDQCGEDPLRGRRWFCTSCLIDLCADCAVALLDPSSSHPPHHRLKTAQEVNPSLSSNTTWDPDYIPQSYNHTYNYLDPNFLPD